MRIRPSPRTIIPVVAALALVACGGDDGSDSVPGDADVATDSETGAPPTVPSVDGTAAVATTVVPGGVEVDEVPADPAERSEPTGTISVGAATWEVAGFARTLEDGESLELGGDFLLCEADDPASPDDANIIAVLDDDLQFSFLQRGDTTTAEYGDLFGAEVTAAVDVERDGTRISGTAEFPDSGAASFEFDCG